MCFGKNIQRAGMWLFVFLVAQGMVYRWGYEQGYFHGARQGYGDYVQEQKNQWHSAEAFRADATSCDAQAPGTEARAARP